MSKLIHIVYSESAKGSFKQAIKGKFITVDKLIALYDDISNGEINNLKDYKSREAWWNELYGDECFYCDVNAFKNNYIKFYDNISKINDGDTVYIWYGHCNSEISGMLYTLYLLKDTKVDVYSINVSDKIVENNQGRLLTYIASSAGEIIHEKLGEYFKLARKLESDEYEKLLSQWNQLTRENSLLRSYKNGEMEICITNDGLKYLSSDKNAMNFWNERKEAKEKKIE